MSGNATESSAYMEYGVRWKDGTINICPNSLDAAGVLQNAKDTVWRQEEGWERYLGAEVIRRRVEVEKSAWEPTGAMGVVEAEVDA